MKIVISYGGISTWVGRHLGIFGMGMTSFFWDTSTQKHCLASGESYYLAVPMSRDETGWDEMEVNKGREREDKWMKYLRCIDR